MAKITVSEHRELPLDAQGRIMPTLGKRLVEQAANAAPSASSALTAAFGADTQFARLCSDVALHVAYDGTTAPTATAASDYYPAGAEIVYRVAPGRKIAYLAG